MIGTRATAQGVQDYWERIVDECSREIAELPNNPLRYYKRAQAYKELGQRVEKLKWWNEMSKSPPYVPYN